jgi:hypothetical protein
MIFALLLIVVVNSLPCADFEDRSACVCVREQSDQLRSDCGVVDGNGTTFGTYYAEVLACQIRSGIGISTQYTACNDNASRVGDALGLTNRFCCADPTLTASMTTITATATTQWRWNFDMDTTTTDSTSFARVWSWWSVLSFVALAVSVLCCGALSIFYVTRPIVRDKNNFALFRYKWSSSTGDDSRAKDKCALATCGKSALQSCAVCSSVLCANHVVAGGLQNNDPVSLCIDCSAVHWRVPTRTAFTFLQVAGTVLLFVLGYIGAVLLVFGALLENVDGIMTTYGDYEFTRIDSKSLLYAGIGLLAAVVLATVAAISMGRLFTKQREHASHRHIIQLARQVETNSGFIHVHFANALFCKTCNTMQDNVFTKEPELSEASESSEPTTTTTNNNNNNNNIYYIYYNYVIFIVDIINVLIDFVNFFRFIDFRFVGFVVFFINIIIFVFFRFDIFVNNVVYVINDLLDDDVVYVINDLLDHIVIVGRRRSECIDVRRDRSRAHRSESVSVVTQRSSSPTPPSSTSSLIC